MTSAAVRKDAWKWRALGVILALQSIAFGIAWIANQHRIQDIQDSRVYSCVRGYDGIRKVFLPLYPPAKSRTPRQQDQINKFERQIDKLKVQCDVQVKAPPVGTISTVPGVTVTVTVTNPN